MALNSSGPLSLGGSTVGQSINLELGQTATALASINAANFRTLAGVASGQISISNFYGKSSSVGYYSFNRSGGATSGSTWSQGGYVDSSGNVYSAWYGNGAFQLDAAGTVQWAKSYSNAGPTFTGQGVINFFNNSSTALAGGSAWTCVGGQLYSGSNARAVIGVLNSSGTPVTGMYAAYEYIPGGYASNSTSQTPIGVSLGNTQWSAVFYASYYGSSPGYYCCGVYYPGPTLSQSGINLSILKCTGSSYLPSNNVQLGPFYGLNSQPGLYTNNNATAAVTFLTYLSSSGYVTMQGWIFTNQTYGRGPLSFRWTSNNFATGGQVISTDDNVIYWAGMTTTGYGVVARLIINANSTFSVTHSVYIQSGTYTFNSQYPPTLCKDSSGNVYVSLNVNNASAQNSKGRWLGKFTSTLSLTWQREIFKTASTISGYTGTNQPQFGIAQMNVSPDGTYLNCFGWYALSYSSTSNLRQGVVLNLPVDGSKTASITVSYPQATSTGVTISYAAASATVASVGLTTTDVSGAGDVPSAQGPSSTIGSATITSPVVSTGNW